MKNALHLFLLVLALTWPLSALAQTDTLRGKNHSVVPVTVQSFSYKAVRVDRLYSYEKKAMEIPYTDLESVKFADGFEVRFQDGKLVRDNLLSAPNYYSRLWTVKVEEVIDLTQSEIRQLYGDRLYFTEYRPNKTRLLTGLGKVAVGFLGFVAAGCTDPTVWDSKHSSSFKRHWDGHSEMVKEDYSKGNLNVGWLSVDCLLLGTFLTGFVDQASSHRRLKALARQREDLPGPTLKKAKTEIWGGTALTAAGAGTMYFFASRLNNHREWYHHFLSNNGVVEKDIHQGEPASGWDLFGLFAGAVAVNLGISTFRMGQTRLSAFRKLDAMPYAMQVDLGPAPAGYGLTVRF